MKPQTPRRRKRNRERTRQHESRIVRIVGGQCRGRLLQGVTDPRTRPMKDRTREALFNLLGPGIRNKHVVDLFAGTSALAFEALSRGAAQATLIEMHVPTAELVKQDAISLGFDHVVEVLADDAFEWPRSAESSRFDLNERDWLVFCSPPYDFYTQRLESLLELIERLIQLAPSESTFVVEADRSFDVARLPVGLTWKDRHYPPAVICIGSTVETGGSQSTTTTIDP